MHARFSNRLIRPLIIAVGAGALAVAAAPAAFAGGQGGVGASCSATRHGCTVTAHDPGSAGSSPGDGAGSGGQSSGGSGGQQSSTSPPTSVKCVDAPFTPSAAQLAAFGSPSPPPGKGHWVIVECTVPGTLGINATLQWRAAGAPVLPDPAVLAAQAESRLVLVKPQIDSSPAVGLAQTVQLPTWTWTPRTQWVPVSATAAVPGESVTATASPTLLSFSWGDGTSSTCQGPGTVYVTGASNPSSPSPTCGHTYRVTSAAAPGQEFSVTATLTWRITWVGGGQSGTFPDMTTSTTVHWSVQQIQSVLVQGGGS